MRRRRSILAAVSVTILAMCGGCATTPDLGPAPESVPLTAEERETLYEQAVAAYADQLRASFPDIELPQVDLVRFIDQTEYAEVFTACITSQGFEAKPNDSGGIEFGEIPAEQAAAQSVALYICRAEYPTDPKYQQALTDEQVNWLYEYSQVRLPECFEAKGAPLPDLPSEAVFAEGYAANDPWNPYAGVPDSIVLDVSRECPAIPPEIWGD